MAEPTPATPHVLMTGGAGYLGSLLTGVLLANGWRVTVADDLLFGGQSLLGYWQHPGFRFAKVDVCDPTQIRAEGELLRVGNLPADRFTAIVHLAALAGFPACQMVGPQVAWRYNFEATRRLYAVADAAAVPRFLFTSGYSNYALPTDASPVTEDASLDPQSLYAETKVASERFLLDETGGGQSAPIIYRLATLFGVAPRMRFDLLVNQFVLEAITRRRIVIYQRGYARSFAHVRDVADAIQLALAAPLSKVARQAFNVGNEDGNSTKDALARMVQGVIEGTQIEYKDLTFGGDTRDVRVSFAKLQRVLGYSPRLSLEAGVREVQAVLEAGVIKDAFDSQYRNAQFLVQ
ncbi:MAG: NAD-dependent epimerase/dehydratase family protein [Oscillochloridaceae bacterium umkhey_bin13]